MKEGLFSGGMAQHSDLQVVDHDLGRNSLKKFQGVAVTGQELLHAFGQGELDIEQPAVTQHHDEEAQAPAGRSDGDRAEVAPVYLSAFARGELQHQVSRLAHRANLANEFLENAVATGVALLTQLLQELLGGVGMPFQQG
jgi:hypothetical protein